MKKDEGVRQEAVQSIEPNQTGAKEQPKAKEQPSRKRWVFRSLTDTTVNIRPSYSRDSVDRHGRTGQKVLVKAVNLVFRRCTCEINETTAKKYDMTAEELATLATECSAYGGINNENNGKFFLVSCPAWSGKNQLGEDVEFAAHELDDVGRKLINHIETMVNAREVKLSDGAKASQDIERRLGSR